MSEPATPRQVLYALVAAGFLGVVGVLTIGAAAVGLVPTWWSAIMAFAIAIAGTYVGSNWRRTGPVLAIGVGLLVAWMVGTLILAS